MSHAAENLERRCQEVLKTSPMEDPEGTPKTILEREMALVLDHIERLRRQDRDTRHQLSKRQNEIETRILNLQPLPNHYLSHHWEERQSLISQLTGSVLRLEDHQQRVAVDTEKQIQAIQIRLLQLLNMRQQLPQYHGDSSDYP